MLSKKTREEQISALRNCQNYLLLSDGETKVIPTSLAMRVTGLTYPSIAKFMDKEELRIINLGMNNIVFVVVDELINCLKKKRGVGRPKKEIGILKKRIKKQKKEKNL
jgi:hypothetical protein